MCDICDGQKMSQFWNCDLSHTLWVFNSFSSIQIWSHFGHKCHKWSQIQMWLVHTCFCFCFDWNGSEWTKYGTTHQSVRSVSFFCLESGSERLWESRERTWDGTGAPNLSCRLSKTPAPQGGLDVLQRRSRLSRLAELLIPITISMPSLVYVVYVNCWVWRNEVYLIKNPLVPGQKTEQKVLGAH